VNKEPTDKNHLYMCLNIDALQKAMNDLTPAQLKVWMYFAKNQNNYRFELSSVAVCAFCGISDKTYREAIKTLVAKRYLVKRDDGSVYDFYEMPKAVEMVKDGTIIECHTSTMLIEK
jgi:hypothetical protein